MQQRNGSERPASGKEQALEFAEFVYMVATEAFKEYIPGDWHKSADAMRNFRSAFDIGDVEGDNRLEAVRASKLQETISRAWFLHKL